MRDSYENEKRFREQAEQYIYYSLTASPRLAKEVCCAINLWWQGAMTKWETFETVKESLEDFVEDEYGLLARRDLDWSIAKIAFNYVDARDRRIGEGA